MFERDVNREQWTQGVTIQSNLMFDLTLLVYSRVQSPESYNKLKD